MNQKDNLIQLRKEFLAALDVGAHGASRKQGDISSAKKTIEELTCKVGFEFLVDNLPKARKKKNVRAFVFIALLQVVKNYNGRKVGDLIYKCMRRPDDLTTLLQMYFDNGNYALSHQLKHGLKRAVQKFDLKSLKSYNNSVDEMTLVDVILLTRPKPTNEKIEKRITSFLQLHV